MNDSETSFAWGAFGITVLIWAPLFVVAIIVLRKRRLAPWKFRLAGSFFAAVGVAPSIIPIHASVFIVPAVTNLLVLRRLDWNALTWAGILGIIPIALATFLVFAVWSIFSRSRSV